MQDGSAVGLPHALHAPSLPDAHGWACDHRPRSMWRSVFSATSILAGCSQSPDWAKIYLFDILQEVHQKWKPVIVSSWLDDLHQRMIGSARAVVQQMVGAAVFLKGKLENLNCIFAPKSFCMASSAALTKQMVEAVAKEGVEVKGQQHGRDLGLDVTFGRARCMVTRRGRLRQAEGRAQKGGMVAQEVGRMGARIATTGAFPQLRWGRPGHGTSASEVAKIRGMMRKGMGIFLPGGCASTAFELAGGSLDPWYRLPMDTTNAFLEMVACAVAEDRKALTAGLCKLIEKIGDMDEARR